MFNQIKGTRWNCPTGENWKYGTLDFNAPLNSSYLPTGGSIINPWDNQIDENGYWLIIIDGNYRWNTNGISYGIFLNQSTDGDNIAYFAHNSSISDTQIVFERLDGDESVTCHKSSSSKV